MIIVIAAMAFALQGTPTDSWTWTLYDSGGPVVLAHEIPDTPQLRGTLECEPGSGMARISAYGIGPGAAFAVLSSGASTGSAEVQPNRGSTPRVSVMLPTAHPIFLTFAETGALTMRTGDRTHAVTVPRPHLAKLRRFAALCGS